MKYRFGLILLAFAMLFAMAGCSENSPALGAFICEATEYQDTSIEPALLIGGDAVLELNEDGKGFFHLGDDVGTVLWSVEGTELKLTFNENTYVGSYIDDCITIDLLGSGLNMSFVRLGSESKDDAVIASVQSYYGWWDIGDAGGEWQQYEEMWFDSCAVIELDEYGKGEFIMWDEDSSYDKPLCRLIVELGEDNSLRVINGAFIDCKVDDSNWKFNTEGLEFSDMMVVELAYSDDKGLFNSVMYFRPWGTIWDDVQEEAPDLLPYYYNDWYLPLVEAGSQMPGEFELD